jgi:hypothetical protein
MMIDPEYPMDIPFAALIAQRTARTRLAIQPAR